MNTTLIFVYGTLKRGFHNNTLLSGAEFVGEATTVGGGFGMASNGSFPAVYRDPASEANVAGELYRVTPKQLERVDRLEGHPEWYSREPIQTTGGEAQAYFMLPQGPYWRTVQPLNGVLTFDKNCRS